MLLGKISFKPFSNMQIRRTQQQVIAQSKRWYLAKQLANMSLTDSQFELTEFVRRQQDRRLHLG